MASSVDQILEVFAVDVLEHDELTSVGLASVDDGDDVRVRELGHGAGLPPEPLHVLAVVAVVLVEDLERHVPLQEPVAGLVHTRHAAAADELLELVPVRDQLTDHTHIVVNGRAPRSVVFVKSR
jgi:hypothetical protein